MHKKKIRSVSSKTLTQNQIIDFLYHFKSGIESGLSTFQIIDILIPFTDNLSFRQDLQLTANKVKLGVSINEALIDLANLRKEIAIQRFIRSLLVTEKLGGDNTELIKSIIKSVDKAIKVEISNSKNKQFFLKDRSEEMAQHDVLDSDDGEIKSNGNQKIETLCLDTEYLEKQNFWKFLELCIKVNCSLLVTSNSPSSIENFLKSLEPKFQKTLKFDISNGLEFLVNSNNQKSTLGYIQAPNSQTAFEFIHLSSAKDNEKNKKLVNYLIKNGYDLILSINEGHDGTPYVSSLSEMIVLYKETLYIQDIFIVDDSRINSKYQTLGYYRSIRRIPKITQKFEAMNISCPYEIFD